MKEITKPVPAMAGTVDRLERSRASLSAVELPHLHSLHHFPDAVDEPTLRLVASIVQETAPRHVMLFGSGPTTELLALLGFADGRLAVTTFEHDPWAARELLSHADPFAINYRWFAFCLCPLVLRRCQGQAVPVYDDGMAVPVVPFPADLVLIDGPPRELGGRQGMMYQALAYARAGSLILLLRVQPEEAAMVEHWTVDLAENVQFIPPGLLGQHLAFVVRKPLRAPFSHDAPCARVVSGGGPQHPARHD
jgi:hypothetical protein